MPDAPATDPTAWLDTTESGAWRSWVRMSEMVRARVARGLQDSGLSEPDYAVLVCLSEHPEHRVRMSDLASVLGWSRSRVSHQVGRMEARGQVTKEGCPGDARGWFAVLSDAGLEEIRRAAPVHVQTVREAFVDALDARQLAELEAIALTVIHHLETLGGPVEGACPSEGTGPEDATGCAG